MSGAKLVQLLLALSVAVHRVERGRAVPLVSTTPTTTRDDKVEGDDIRLELETSLNFDRLVLFGDGQGSATIRPDGSSAATGSVSSVGPRAMVGTVVVHGQAGGCSASTCRAGSNSFR